MKKRKRCLYLLNRLSQSQGWHRLFFSRNQQASLLAAQHLIVKIQGVAAFRGRVVLFFLIVIRGFSRDSRAKNSPPGSEGTNNKAQGRPSGRFPRDLHQGQKVEEDDDGDQA